MKVAFDHRIFSMQRFGGVSRYFFELACRLPSETVSEVSVVAPLYINNYLAGNSARSFSHGKYVPSDIVGLPHIVGLANRIASPFAWSGLNPDIVHETYFNIIPVGRGRRRVVTIYDMIHELFVPNGHPLTAAKRAAATAAKRAAVNRADHVICISETTRSDLVRLYNIDPSRTSVVHLGYSLTSDLNEITVQRKDQRPSFLYVGNRKGYKNFETLLQAFSSSRILREFDLIAFGGHPTLPEEREEIGRLGITDRVHFKSGSDQALSECYRAATAFVYPSKYEGFGIPPLEAMSHGCPVVCSSGGAIPEVVGNAGMYFDPDNPEELRTSLEHVATNEGLQANLRVRGHSRISAFSWDRCAEATAQIYREIL